ncbi:DUF2145 domain-containing protein [Teredinibacter purpureus]|uniref:DUF2145 domain-containing protein n=1 Tax=Teredinibacter purpureus TaxID=2731756 RepID=UPI0005F7E659|nr:DUF2145 domain-containing protein [Teredinibacter purpureus]
MNRLILQSLVIFCLVAALSNLSWAGSARSNDSLFAPEAIATFAKTVEQTAAKEGALAFIIGRVGRPKDALPVGINFTHTAIALYSSITLGDGTTAKGYAIHNLYQTAEDSGKSELVTDYPVDFFWSAKSLTAGIIIPTRELQLRLIELVNSSTAQTLHNPQYSAIANPFNLIYQNCTEYTLDLLNAAIYQTTDREQLKANASAHFTPVTVKVSPLKMALGSIFMPDVSTRDHSGTVATATFGAIAHYLRLNELSQLAVTVDQNGVIDTIL